MDTHELRDLAAVAQGVAIHASVQTALLDAEDRARAHAERQEDLRTMTPGELSAAFGEKPYTIREAIRRKQLPVVKPSPGAKRNCRVSLGEFKKWRGERN